MIPLLLLQMNDLMRDKLSSKNGEIPLWAELLAGGCVSSSGSGFSSTHLQLIIAVYLLYFSSHAIFLIKFIECEW